MSDVWEPNGGSLSVATNQPDVIGPGHWAQAEKAARRIIRKVQPTLVSDARRREVVDYVQGLLFRNLPCEVFPYGSVPLKTYLPDGDIDLTAFAGASEVDNLAEGMVSILEGEDQSRAAEFAITDTKLVRAEVKIVKCIVQNVVVDISFNQIGGLCTLGFLEEVDCLIGKDHLFKRSIILIKAWCYYESRVLGAHHGLISTYALETLVLHIFHLFHSTLSGPLQVLYKFLDYFSKFDWENYCVSVTGPVRLSSLPDLVEIPDNGGSDLLLSRDFLWYFTDKFSVPSRGFDPNSRTFQPKHLNIVDPLKEANNLGRSVSKGNFYRIRSAFTYGTKKLGRVLGQPEDDIADGLSRFFFNTLDRHGDGQRPDVEVARPLCASHGSCHELSTSGIEEAEEGRLSKLSLESQQNGLDQRFMGDAREHSMCAPYPAHHLHISRSNGKIPSDDKAGVSNGSVSNGCVPWSDLGGDRDHQMWCLERGRWLHDYVTNGARHPGPPPSLFPGHHSRQNGFPHMRASAPLPNPALYAVHPIIPPPPGPPPPPRGTGTFYPNRNHVAQAPHRPPPVITGGSHGNLRVPRRLGRSPVCMETNTSPDFLHTSGSAHQTRRLHSSPLEERGHPNMNGHVLPSDGGSAKNVPAETNQPDRGRHNRRPLRIASSSENASPASPTKERGHPNMNGHVLPPDGGSAKNVPAETNQPDRGRHNRRPLRIASSSENASPASPTKETQNLKPVSSGDHDRVSVESSYHLKDEDDFPPLLF